MSSSVVVAQIPERRWWNFIGPWPFRPLLMWVASTLFYNITAVGAMTNSGNLSLRNFAVVGLSQAFISSLPIAAFMWLGKRWQVAHGVHWGSYLFFIACAAIGALTIRYFLVLRNVPPGDVDIALSIATSRVTLFLFVVLALAGAVTERLQRQVIATQEALEEARSQQEQILRADEEARRQVAELLHDRVQAGLIAACLELQALPEDEQREAAIATIVQRLENLRAIDVRRAARALSPSLQDVDLHAALRELGSQYEPRMITSVDVATDVENLISDPETRLGLYRITEQALMNSAIHGFAQHVDVSIRVSGDFTIEWEVRDDGKGLSDGPVDQGLGSALTNTWMRRLRGEWSLKPRDGGGAVCRAAIPIVQRPSQL